MQPVLQENWKILKIFQYIIWENGRNIMGQSCGRVVLFPAKESLSHFGIPGGIYPKVVRSLTLKNASVFDSIKRNKGVVGTFVW